MTLYIIAALVVALLAGIGGAFLYGRSSGRQAQRVGDLDQATTIKDKQLAEANKPRDPQSTVDSLKSGDF